MGQTKWTTVYIWSTGQNLLTLKENIMFLKYVKIMIVFTMETFGGWEKNL